MKYPKLTERSESICGFPPPTELGHDRWKLVDSDLRVVSSAVDDLPEWIRNEFLHSSPGDDISNLTFFYHPKLDIVVLNSENRHADLYELLVTTYLPADAEDRRKFKTEAPAKAVGHAIEVLDYIIEKRGKHA